MEKRRRSLFSLRDTEEEDDFLRRTDVFFERSRGRRGEERRGKNKGDRTTKKVVFVFIIKYIVHLMRMGSVIQRRKECLRTPPARK